jgi:hypothetical protein
MNRGGFSWKRLLGISAAKSRVSRAIGIPLTASGRQRKLGATIFKALGPVAGTVAVAAVSAAKHSAESRPGTASPKATQAPRTSKGIHYCLVKGVTHQSDDGMSHRDAQQLCSIGDAVNLVPDPHNPHDRNAIRVKLKTGEQIGYISASQASRFAGKVHLLSATVHSRVADDWGNETVKLRVVNTEEQAAHDPGPLSPTDPFLPRISALQTEAQELAKKRAWQSVVIYFENAERGLYQVVLAEDAEHMRLTLREGLTRVGFIGMNDAPKGIQFGFELEDAIPTDGPVAKRFLVNGKEWVTTRSRNLCAEKGIAAPVVHEFQPSQRSLNGQMPQSVADAHSSKRGGSPLVFGAVLGVTGLFVAIVTGEWRVPLVVVIFAAFFYGSSQGRLQRVVIASILGSAIYQAWGLAVLMAIVWTILTLRRSSSPKPV